MIPGFLCDETLFDQVAELMPAGTCDIRLPGALDSIDAMADEIAASQDSDFILVGHSLGGRIALTIAARRPERCRGLVLMSTSARAAPAELVRRLGKLTTYLRKPGAEKRLPDLLSMLFSQNSFRDPAIREKASRMAARFDLSRIEAQVRAMIDRPDNRSGAGRIDVPTLIVCGRDDTATPVGLHEELEAIIPGSVLRIIPECGHLPPLEQPAEISRILQEWVGSLTGSASVRS